MTQWELQGNSDCIDCIDLLAWNVVEIEIPQKMSHFIARHSVISCHVYLYAVLVHLVSQQSEIMQHSAVLPCLVQGDSERKVRPPLNSLQMPPLYLIFAYLCMSLQSCCAMRPGSCMRVVPNMMLCDTCSLTQPWFTRTGVPDQQGRHWILCCADVPRSSHVFSFTFIYSIYIFIYYIKL